MKHDQPEIHLAELVRVARAVADGKAGTLELSRALVPFEEPERGAEEAPPEQSAACPVCLCVYLDGSHAMGCCSEKRACYREASCDGQHTDEECPERDESAADLAEHEYRCASCERLELDCSEDPCGDVRRDREGEPAREALLRSFLGATVAVLGSRNGSEACDVDERCEFCQSRDHKGDECPLEGIWG